MGLFKKKRVLVIVDEKNIPIDPKTRESVKYIGKERKWKQILFGAFILFCLCAAAFFGSVLLWEMIKS